MQLSKNQKKLIFSILGILIVGSIVFFLFSKPGAIFQVKGEPESIKKPEEITTIKSPFSGLACKNYQGRAFGVVLAQYPETMPLSSPSQADLVIEGPVANPGGITRLIAIFQCQSPQEIGSIRSVRPYMVDLALGYDLIFSSWGGCDAGISRIKNLGLDWLDARVNPSGAFFRKQNISAPHNGFTSLEGLKKASQNLGMRQENRFEGYQFLKKDEIVYQKTPQEIEINYSYPVKWTYDPENGDYLRFWNGNKMIDRNTAKQVKAKNIVVMKTEMGVLSEGVVNVKTEGSGKATFYQGGKETKGSWKKESPQGKLTFFDENGKEFKFIPGQIWIEVTS